MTDTPFAAWIDEMTLEARAAGIVEQEHQKEAARRAVQLKDVRAFAWRRLNLMRTLASAVRGAENAEAAGAAGRRVLLREVGWNGATEAQREVAERFAPVVLAVWAATRPEPEPADVPAAWTGFEDWYADARGGPFLALMEREIVELPLVEV